MTSLSVIVPTLGRSPYLGECLERLRHDAGVGAQIVLVVQGSRLADEVVALADVVLRLACNRGFAAANNLAFPHCRGDWIALVNDDVLIDDGWCEALIEALRQRPQAAAAQGVLRRLDDPTRLDGWGIGWNRHWQAVQLGHGEPTGSAPRQPRELFGVSATAAIYRREALASVLQPRGEDPTGQIFDQRLFAYYEDVHLAVRLRQAGFEAWLEPTAGARHSGSISGKGMSLAGQQWIYGNRHLVLMDLLGRRWLGLWPRILWRDALDLVRQLMARRWRSVAGILAGWWRAGRWSWGFLRFGAPRLSSQEMARFRDAS